MYDTDPKPTAKGEGAYLTIRIPITEPRPSSTGKTCLVGTFNGVVDTTYNGRPIRVTASATIKP